MFRFKKERKIKCSPEVPKHIGIIMDGNGRWAKNGCNLVSLATKPAWRLWQEVTIAAKEMGVKALTVYAFN